MSNEDEKLTPFQAFTEGMTENYSDAARALIEHGVNEPIAWAIATSIRDFISTTGAASTGEEHRTSALMGFIATAMGVFHRLALMSGQSSEMRLLWHAARKQSSAAHGLGEDKVGGDFGVAVPLPDDRFRISFFQAKNQTSQGELNIGRPPKPDKSDNWPAKAAAANNRLARWAVEDVIEAEDAKAVDHQMIKLARTQQKGRVAAGGTETPSSRNWVHYIAWSGEQPWCFGLDSCRTNILGNNRLRPLHGHTTEVVKAVTCIKLSDVECYAFADHLARGMCTDAEGWIELSKDDAKAVVGEFAALGADWYIADDTTGRGAKGLTDDATYCLNTAASAATEPVVIASAEVAKANTGQRSAYSTQRL